MHTGRKIWEDWIMQSQVKKPPETGREIWNRPFPSTLWGIMAQHTLWYQASSLQNWQAINIYFSSHVVYGTLLQQFLGNKYKGQEYEVTY